MLYRVDYTLGVIVGGFVSGVLLGRYTKLRSAIIANGYFYAVLVLLIPSIFLNIVSFTFGARVGWTVAGLVVGTAGGFIFGALFGIAAGRLHEGVELIEQPPVLAGLRISVAFTFVLAGMGKAFNMPFMTSFFAQSGYPVAFLKFIMVTEAIAGVALLVDWFFLPSLLWLSVDMFGAVVTHVHNGDPLDDSTGAINMLLRLAAIGVVWALSNGSSLAKPNRRFRLRMVACLALLCVLLAVVGGVGVRHFWQPH